MSKVTITISIEEDLADKVDRLVEKAISLDRGSIVELALRKTFKALDKDRFKRECLKLDPLDEQRWAEQFR